MAAAAYLRLPVARNTNVRVRDRRTDRDKDRGNSKGAFTFSIQLPMSQNTLMIAEVNTFLVVLIQTAQDYGLLSPAP